jgi:hypothetical protein
MTVALAVLAAGASLTAQQPEIKPGPEHKKLKEEEGTWDATVKADKTETKGVMTCKMGLNGLWLIEHFQGSLEGAPFEGHGATSYDAAKKKYVNVWIDSMATSPMLSEGSYDDAKKTMTMVGNMPMPDGKNAKVTMVTVLKDANTKVFTLRGPGPDGKEAEMLQITYKRRAK